MVYLSRKRKKSVKMRGSKTHGYGEKKKHRGAGHKGGHGMAGGHKHKWTYVVKYEPDRFGKYGFSRPPELRRRLRTINIYELESKLDYWVGRGLIKKEGDSYLVNLRSLGYDKLLGTGRVTRKFRIQADYISRVAKEKIEGAGGSVESLTQGESSEESSTEVSS